MRIYTASELLAHHRERMVAHPEGYKDLAVQIETLRQLPTEDALELVLLMIHTFADVILKDVQTLRQQTQAPDAWPPSKPH